MSALEWHTHGTDQNLTQINCWPGRVQKSHISSYWHWGQEIYPNCGWPSRRSTSTRTCTTNLTVRVQSSSGPADGRIVHGTIAPQPRLEKKTPPPPPLDLEATTGSDQARLASARRVSDIVKRWNFSLSRRASDPDPDDDHFDVRSTEIRLGSNRGAWWIRPHVEPPSDSVGMIVT